MIKPKVIPFFDETTNTVSYVVADPDTNTCAIIDSLLDYDASSGRTGTKSVDRLIKYVEQSKLTVDWIIDTHVHADHLTAAPYVRDVLGGRTAIGENIVRVQKIYGEIFNEGQTFHTDGSQFDHLFKDGETYTVGNINARAIYTPGHTPACMSHLIGDALFVGDTLFMPDSGTARCDFPGGDAQILYRSIHKLFDLPNETRAFMCHDYKAAGRDEFAWESTISEQKEKNIHVNRSINEREFIEMRTVRDAKLSMPKLLLPSVQVNMRAGNFPEPEANGKQYLKVPINTV